MNRVVFNVLTKLIQDRFLKHTGLELPKEVSQKDMALLTLKKKDGAVIVIIGTRDTGKTELAYRLAEFLGKPTYAVSPEQHPRPHFIQRIKFNEIDEIVKPGSTLILDDAPAYISSRDYHEELVRQLERIIPMVRHERKLHLIVVTQSGAFIDKWALDAEAVFLKPLSLLSEDIERPGVRRLYQYANLHFEGKDLDWVKRHCFLATPTWRGILEVKMVK